MITDKKISFLLKNILDDVFNQMDRNDIWYLFNDVKTDDIYKIIQLGFKSNQINVDLFDLHRNRIILQILNRK